MFDSELFALQQNNLLNDINWGVVPLDLRQTDITQTTGKDKENNRDRNKNKEIEKWATNKGKKSIEVDMERGRERGGETNSNKLNCFHLDNTVSNNGEIQRLTRERTYLQAR